MRVSQNVIGASKTISRPLLLPAKQRNIVEWLGALQEICLYNRGFFATAAVIRCPE